MIEIDRKIIPNLCSHIIDHTILDLLHNVPIMVETEDQKQQKKIPKLISNIIIQSINQSIEIQTLTSSSIVDGGSSNGKYSIRLDIGSYRYQMTKMIISNVQNTVMIR